MRAVILFSLLLIIGMVQVLPQADLPDTAFREGTLPHAVRAHSLNYLQAVPIRTAGLRHQLATTQHAYRAIAAQSFKELPSISLLNLLC